MNKLLQFFKNKCVTYALVLFIYLVGVVGANVLDGILVDAGECFSIAWNVLAAWTIIRYYQKKWIVQLDKTRFFNLYLLLGLLVIAINFMRYIGPADFHSPTHLYIVAFIVAFGTCFAEETVLRALTIEVFVEKDKTIKWYKILVAIGVFVAYAFLKDFLSSLFLKLITNPDKVADLLTQSIFWKPILDNMFFQACFGFFLFAIYRKTNLSTCVIISIGFTLLQYVTSLSVSATYLPETVGNAMMIVNLIIMVASGLFFTLYKKKLPQNLEYEERTDEKK